MAKPDVMRLRRATPADVEAVCALVEGAYRGDGAKRGWTHEADLLGGQRTDAADIAGAIADPAVRILLAEGPPGLLGCVRVEDRGDGLGYLGMLTVRPDLQAGGLGRRLIAAAEADARARGARRMEMTVIVQRPELIAYYERRGYRLTGERRAFPYGDERFGLPARADLEFVVMEKRLDQDQ